ncbi:branched-chain amino acid ABC transporter permease/ATP-binding protein [Rhodococcus wratislaviensis]|uniref:Putative ABC transporter ATP-binding protein n=1 Tax=Rhodococcus wratislaviensis NBRC 100605 TaxID=1219028 RepID=X0Q9P1_RHOWR|nr:branched-chain amino acid ABC transporter permease/ATP-binding protein [Rhodococcus wratislaviensis]GAF47636.1 putative ABC transporter ATP-binding protein [Rhodococcus wratislaviensis NBRC 100605]
MHEVVLFAILGLGAGSAYALIAQGMILVHRATGVVNFAQGALALVGASTYVWLTNSLGLPTVGAAVLAVAITGAVGAMIQRFVMRPLGRAPMLAKLVAVLGLILLLQGLVLIAFGTDHQAVKPLIPNDSMGLFGLTIGRDRLILLLIALFFAAVLSIFAQRTTMGALFRAASDSEEGVSILGYSLNALATSTWVVGAMLAGFAGIVIAPITSLSSTTFVLLVIPALAVALPSAFSSFWIATGAALLLGVVQSEIARFWTHDSPTIQGMQQALPFLLIILVMVARGRAVPGRGAITLGRPPLAPPVRIRPIPIAMIVLGAMVVTAVATRSYQTAITVAMISALVALSLVVLTGYVGQISLAQMMFAGLGALFCSIFANNVGLPFPLPIIAAGLAVVPFGLLLGIPALRVRGVSLAVVTLGAAVAVDALVFADPKLTGGVDGISVPAPQVFGYSLDGVLHPFRFAMFVLVVLLLAVLGVARLRSSRLGLKMLATRDNERAAAAEGVNTVQTKLIAFSIAAFLAGVAGSLFGYLYGHLAFESFAPFTSIAFITTAYIGGIGSVVGALLAGLLAAGGPFFNLLAGFASVDQFQLVIAGAGVILTAVLNPDGIAPAFGENIRQIRVRLTRTPDGPQPQSSKSAGDPQRIDLERRRANRPAPGDVLLETSGLSVQFGAVHAVDDVDVVVRQGMLVGLIGPNGAGKTTLIDAVCGFVPSMGRVDFDGRPLDGLRVHQRARRGVRRTFQSVELFEDLTVQENLVVPSRGEHDPSLDDQLSVDSVLDLVGLSDKAELYPRQLSAGETKLVGLARALRGEPKLLLLDEPAAGLDSHESRRLGDRLVRLVDMGITIVLVDHDLDLVMGVCDEVVVLERGRVLVTGEPAEVRNDPRVRAAYIGADPDESVDAAKHDMEVVVK